MGQMATSTLLRSAARSFLKCQDLAATRCLPATGAKAWIATPLISQRSLVRPDYSDVSGLELAKQREALKVTDDIVNSEAKLHALFLKWLSYNDHHFDVEDEKAFKKRFDIFKGNARFVNQHNKSGSSSTVELNYFADMTTEEYLTKSWENYPKKIDRQLTRF